jgi:hypothetical protein
MVMETPPTHPGIDPAAVVRLRQEHRCARCHKHCLVPCRFTAAEFRQLVDGDRARGGPAAGPEPGPAVPPVLAESVTGGTDADVRSA